MRTIVNIDLKLSPLKLKKHQHLTGLQQQKRAEWAGLLWNLLKSGTQIGEIIFFRRKNIHCGGKVQSKKWQSAGPIFIGRCWKYVNRLLLPEASICHGLGCSVKKIGNLLWFLWKGCQIQHKCVHRWNFGSNLVWYERALQKWRFHIPTGRCSLSHLQQNPSLAQRQFPSVL